MSHSKTYDVIVLGVGSMGAAACYHLAQRGCRVLGLEQFDIPHERGSHGGQTRIIRKAYGENTKYVPLLQRAYENWKSLETETNTQLYHETGLLYFGNEDSEFLNTLHRSSEEYDVPVHTLTSNECSKRYPQFDLPSNLQRILEPGAGLLLPEYCIRVMAIQAKAYGADIHERERVRQWREVGDELLVTTNRAVYKAQKLVITAGPWAVQMIPTMHQQVAVTRQALAWVQPQVPEDFELGTFPTWLFDAGDHVYYGFPIMPQGTEGPHGLKVGLHRPLGEVVDPDHVDRNRRPSDEEAIVRFLKEAMPSAYRATIEMKTCLYTNSPDHEFIVDFLPHYEERVVVACGFSGHGFKFASVIGEVLADLATEGSTSFDIDFLSAQRLR